ncbi:MAG: lipoprotein signal peptidase [Bacteroidales bacterium]|nr:lipoprotein signal peptidase [Bacteroidales bacterium]
MKPYKIPVLIIFFILLFDQILKIWIKTHMMLGQEYHIFGNWFIIHFTENNGMAFGLEIAGEFGKIFLSLFRIIAVAGIGWYLTGLIKEKAPKGLIISISIIMAGAIGNIIDSAFYGIIFNESYGQIASIFPVNGGYSSFLHGRVVDMFYFPIIECHLPEWFPIWGSKHFIFFRPVFNIADSSITIGVSMIFLFQKKYFKKNK